MMTSQVICFGEVLWDVFPNHSVIGGAPLNVALRLKALGATSALISKIGNDSLGEKISAYLDQIGLSREFIQVDDTLPTGTVDIQLSENGSASYEISKPVAWDTIEISETIMNAVQEAPFFLFGSLAMRGGMNREALRKLLPVANTRIFDVNLRPPHYHNSMVYELMQLADFVKLNDEELLEVCEDLGCQEVEMKEQIVWLQRITKTPSICVTRGAAGALLYFEEQFFEHQGFSVKVADTVGAGDSFLATLIYYLLLKNTKPANALTLACGMGALVASKDGANCPISEKELQDFIHV